MKLKIIPLLGVVGSGLLFVSLTQAEEPTTLAVTQSGMSAMPMDHEMPMDHAQMQKRHEAMMTMPAQAASSVGGSEMPATTRSAEHEQHHPATP